MSVAEMIVLPGLKKSTRKVVSFWLTTLSFCGSYFHSGGEVQPGLRTIEKAIVSLE
jgi:hypothetical protein